MRKAFYYGSTAATLRPDPPGEPLYTFDEIAAKLKITPDILRKLRMQHPGFVAWRPNVNKAAGPQSRFRYSDARKWFNSIPKAPS